MATPSGEFWESTSNRGVQFEASVVGVRWTDGTRADLEDTHTTLSDRDLQSADYVVVHIRGGGEDHYKTIVGPWDDWDQLYDDVEDFFDEY